MKHTILLIEDATEILENITEILLLNDYDVLGVTNGAHALASLEEHKPDLILCDILLPGMNGFDILRHIRSKQEFSKIPFIFLTSQSERRDQQIARRMGATDYIVKPFDGELLIKKISGYVSTFSEICTSHD